MAFKTLYPEKDFIALPVDDVNPVTMALFYQKQSEETANPIYQTFIQAALKLVNQP
jgi:hypothetical protein